MLIDSIELREIRLPLRHPFETSLGRTSERHILLVRVTDGDGVEGWGECTADEDPFYSEEWTESAWGVIRSYLAPMTLGREIEGAAQVFDLMRCAAAITWRRPRRDRRLGFGGQAPGPAALAAPGRRAPRDTVRRLRRHPGDAPGALR